MRNKQFIIASLLLALVAIGISYSAITQKSMPVTTRSRITSNTMNNIVQDISALNLAIDGITAGSDVKIGTLTSGKWCTSDGGKVNCTTTAPVLTETDPKVGTITDSKYCVGISGKVDCTANSPTVTETDPKVGALTNSKWCTSDGSKINCAENAPSGSVNETTVDGYVSNNGYLTAEIDPKIGTITESKYCMGIGGKVECTANASITKFIDGTNTNDAVYMTGKVGIGTTDPFSKLTIDTGNITLTDNYKLQWGGGNNFIGGSTVSNFVAIGTNGSEKMRVIADGKVGIGTTTPTAELEVNGNIIASAPTEDNHVATKAYVDANSGSSWSQYQIAKHSVNSFPTCPADYTMIWGVRGNGTTKNESFNENIYPPLGVLDFFMHQTAGSPQNSYACLLTPGALLFNPNSGYIIPMQTKHCIEAYMYSGTPGIWNNYNWGLAMCAK